MTSQKRTTLIMDFKFSGLAGFICLAAFSLLVCLCDSACWAVTSKIVRHSSGADFLKGETEDVVVGSKGTVQLGRAWQTPIEEFEDVWSINSIVVEGGTIFIGTSPNGGIFKYSFGELTKIYPAESEEEEIAESDNEQAGDTNDVDDTNDANVVDEEEHLANEHIFAMATDVAGRLVAGISGDECRLLRFEGQNAETIFEPNDAKYIFAIVTDDKGNIYIGTGPEGKVYRVDPFNPASTGLIYDSLDKNILSLAVKDDGFVYAGSDSRGLVYKIDPETKTASVLFDSDQPEITALLFGKDGALYATATSAAITQTETQFAAQLPLAGRPETSAAGKDRDSDDAGGRTLSIPGTKGPGGNKAGQAARQMPKLAEPTQASHIHKITEDGYVTNIFSERAVFFCLAPEQSSLLLGTGNSGQLFTVEPATEQQAIIYEDEQASQITAVVTFGRDVYLGTANPPKLIKLIEGFAAEGTYTSDLVDAGQPAKWGKLQIDADVPAGCTVEFACRSGNVQDVNDPTFSDWTEAEEITGPMQLRCPLGRFCQYKLILRSADRTRSPLVREVAVADTVPNLAPKVEAVTVSRNEGPGKAGTFKIAYKANDDNEDTLIYKIDLRKIGRTNWIELEDQVEKDTFEWDGKTVDDGRYEIRVTVSDERSNTTATKLTGNRVSDPLIVDNTGPVVKDSSIEKHQDGVTLKLDITDELSAIGKVEYTVDSNAEWKGTLPDDFVSDTTHEKFTVVIGDLKAGEHVIAFRISDQIGNTTYESFEVAVEGD